MVYRPSTIKRHRATKAETGLRRAEIYTIVKRGAPMTVRQTFYQCTVHGIVDKTENGYRQVQYDLTEMRKSGWLPYDWLADFTRWERKPLTYNDVEEALRETARLYRKSLWRDADCYVEVWLEKDALAGVVYPITGMFDVPLMSARGYASLSFLHTSGTYIAGLDVPAFIYHLGDFDPSGQDAARATETSLRGFAPDAEINFTRLAVTERQIKEWALPTRPTKKSDSRAKNFGDISVELDAIDPQMLRDLVEDAILQHLPRDQFDILKTAEKSERETLSGMFGLTGRP
ncbi:hypothetical protein [Phyllobacterium chamaecytisi]|uniref:hypothetical protein n=1 Tax=Phyllobacterium chamaecytisi TaxID=2876082 RepID=UPI001CC93FD1|nr:hypothetical protein [Phyllobacterium sp. KW56]MBZ9604259.1 hypothetical protein [Phyllobacterium sp. KW56]